MRNRRKESILFTTIEPNSATTEAYRNLRASLTNKAWDKQIQSLVFTSPQSGDGTTTLLANLAALTAQDYKKVLLIDGQLRKPKMHQLFRVSNRIGLSDLLSSNAEPKEVLIQTDIEHLYLLPAGPVRVNAAELIGTQYLAKLIDEFRKDFDVVFIDCPAVLPFSDCKLWARVSDGIVLIVRNQKTTQTQLVHAQNQLEVFREKLLGIIMLK